MSIGKFNRILCLVGELMTLLHWTMKLVIRPLDQCCPDLGPRTPEGKQHRLLGYVKTMHTHTHQKLPML